jgi:uncharacterized cupin superfamily protein
VTNRRIHIALTVRDLTPSIQEYSRRLGVDPCCVVAETYALFRTDQLNLSISVDRDAAGTLRHLGFEDPDAREASVERDVNGIDWERFTQQQQRAEIERKWPSANFEKAETPSTERRSPHVVNLTELEGQVSKTGTRFAALRKRLGTATRSRGVGCSWYQVPPGATAFPRHSHAANEEAVFILEGSATLKLGTDAIALRVGDYATMPVGTEFAHEIKNTGSTPLSYLCLSTMLPVEVVCFPDSKKILALANPTVEAAGRGESPIRLIAFEASSVDFFAGERVSD